MLRFLIVGLLISTILLSGCIDTELGTSKEPVYSDQTESMADQLIEQEMENAIRDIDTEDLEDLIPE